jgi:hypothetical protein
MFLPRIGFDFFRIWIFDSTFGFSSDWTGFFRIGLVSFGLDISNVAAFVHS